MTSKLIFLVSFSEFASRNQLHMFGFTKFAQLSWYKIGLVMWRAVGANPVKDES